MKILHIFKIKPDAITTMLAEKISEGKEISTFELYGDDVDYDKLIEIIFEHEKIFTWW